MSDIVLYLIFVCTYHCSSVVRILFFFFLFQSFWQDGIDAEHLKQRTVDIDSFYKLHYILKIAS